ncbi:hypothetical protein [Granulicatella sp. zg-ZJ]|nr:hypothetical protein [Granulicatella sp. zg-ZJ]
MEVLLILFFVVVRNMVNYVVIPFLREYGMRWIEKHFNDDKKE